VLAPDHRANGRSDAGDRARWTVPQMADDVEALIGALAPAEFTAALAGFLQRH
jgi:pimeloyl-ACP methyl ester carboxylesterase